MGPKIVNIKDRFKNKDPNKSREDVMEETINELAGLSNELAKQVYDLTISQQRLAKIIGNQNKEIEKLKKGR
ncbi:hypothetical protein BKP56_06965 [Marinilactibacillus sp. 15R]|uniref:hypothetical protein n=1 Tax=Marinilactibacillus sp. 15R TaxID=1911586 RepID=UPI00090B682D|nr:hypothetical protein [Marinilactibacillus sp. 15R]API89010.1 hypothetical protein BKP56_06965 [Marinilactibacillus sp. 15R]